jgi:hypothetical protein
VIYWLAQHSVECQDTNILRIQKNTMNVSTFPDHIIHVHTWKVEVS